MDEQEDQAYDQPDYGEGVEDALEEEFQLPVPSCQLPALTASVYMELLAELVALLAGKGSFDSANASLREAFAPLRMTGVCIFNLLRAWLALLCLLRFLPFRS